MLALPNRGFIEYIPGEYAWRPVDAKGYMFIHCLWVVGKSKGHGFAGLLLKECIRDARRAGMHGVAIATSEGNWLAGKKILLKHGFKSVDKAPPSFELMANKFDDVPAPSFTHNWEARRERYGNGLTIVRSDQCPYLEDATKILVETAEELGIESHVIELQNCREVRELAPSAYGVFNVVYNGKLLSYHYSTKKDLLKRLEKFK